MELRRLSLIASLVTVQVRNQGMHALSAANLVIIATVTQSFSLQSLSLTMHNAFEQPSACPNAASGSHSNTTTAGGNKCFKCGDPGHYANACPGGGSGGGTSKLKRTTSGRGRRGRARGTGMSRGRGTRKKKQDDDDFDLF